MIDDPKEREMHEEAQGVTSTVTCKNATKKTTAVERASNNSAKIGQFLIKLSSSSMHGILNSLHISCIVVQSVSKETHIYVAVHLGVKMADTLSFTAKVDMVDF